MAGVLEGIRVLDMGRVLAGPSAAALFGDMGDVYKSQPAYHIYSEIMVTRPSLRGAVAGFGPAGCPSTMLPQISSSCPIPYGCRKLRRTGFSLSQCNWSVSYTHLLPVHITKNCFPSVPYFQWFVPVNWFCWKTERMGQRDLPLSFGKTEMRKNRLARSL